MTRFIFGIIFLIALVICFILRSASRRAAKDEMLSNSDRRMAGTTSKGLSVAIVSFAILAPLFLVWSVVRVVPANNVGIPVAFGQIGAPLQSGFQVVAPWTSVDNISTRLQVSEFSDSVGEGDRDGADAVEVRVEEYQLRLDVNIRWSVEKEKADDLYRLVGTLDDIREKIVRPISRESLRNVASQGEYTAEGIYETQRSEYTREAIDALAPLLKAEGIILEDNGVNFRGVTLPANLDAAITLKAKATEDAERAIIEQGEAITRAQTKVEEATRNKVATETNASAQAEAEKIRAEGTATANRTVEASLTPDILRLRELEALNNADTIYVPLGADILIGATSANPN